MKFIKRSFIVGGIAGCIGIITGGIYFGNSLKAAEPLVDGMGARIKEYNSKPSKIYSANGKLLYEVKPIYRDTIELSTLPTHVKQAILAAEDKRFYDHPGVDFLGLSRAVRNVVSRGEVNGGGSTITMQLAKKLFSASEMSIQRKVQDIAIAIEIEKRYTKDQILEIYINQIYYGEQAYGLNAAAEIYFNKQASELDLAEAAMIARCIRLPSSQNPVKNYQKADENKLVVLNSMKEEGWITDSEYQKAKAEKPKVRGLSKQKFSRTYMAPYYVAAVKRELERQNINISEGGYNITTTLDTDLQDEAERSVRNHVRGNRGLGVNVGAFLCIDSEGRVLADVGGMNFAKNQYSYTTQSKLQPGSSFKSFVYAEALKDGIIGEYSEISNEQIREPLGGGRYYTPKNHGGYGGTVDLFTAFVKSINVPAVHTFKNMGKQKAATSIKEDFGFMSDIKALSSTALGASEVRPIEMAEAYSVFMLDGKRVQPYYIKEIINPSGEVIYTGRMDFVTTRIGPDVCRIMDKLMRGVVTSGTGRRAGECPDAHGKTGTTNGGKSVWFCGYAKGIVGISWCGSEYYDKKRQRWLLREMPESYGGDVAAPMWADAMNAAVQKYGNDVKPDFSVRPERNEPRRAKKAEDDANNEPPLEEDGNNAPTDPVDPSAPANTDGQPPVDNGNGNTTDPLRDQGQDPTLAQPPVKQPEKPEKPKTEVKPKRHEENEMVEVEVCADSGLLATRYCPETINRTVAKNKRPKSRCKIHKAPDEGGGI